MIESDLFIISMACYLIGVYLGKLTEKWKQEEKRYVWQSHYWYTCKECMPHVIVKFGAENKDHLDQMIAWHEEDYHPDEVKADAMS